MAEPPPTIGAQSPDRDVGPGGQPAPIAMTAQANPRLLSASASLLRAAGVVAVGVGGAVLIGWMLDIASLKSVLPGLVTMKPNTALAFVLSGVSLWLSLSGARTDARQAQRRIAQACAVIVVVIGLLTLAEYVSGLDLGIDQRLFAEPSGAVGTVTPGRMAPTTALNFLMINRPSGLCQPQPPSPARFRVVEDGPRGSR